jgi:hypothetical protein
MAGGCCQLVGDLKLGMNGCIISINTNCSTEGITACGDDRPLEGPTTGTVSITAYADNKPWEGCAAKAGLNVPYIRKYDCETDTLYFIPSGQGQAFTTGDTQGFASVKSVLSVCEALSASSTNGPAAQFLRETQINGYGLSYNGGPISISTTPEMEPSDIGVGPAQMYLQSFSFDAQPGQIPTVTYSYIHGG